MLSSTKLCNIPRVVWRVVCFGLCISIVFFAFIGFDLSLRGELSSITVDFYNLYSSIEAYNNKHGSYPQSLNSLGRRFFERSLLKLIGTETVYKASKMGFKVYLVGFNRKDDGGKVDDINYNRAANKLVLDWSEVDRVRGYLRKTAIAFGIVFLLFGIWPHRKRKAMEKKG